MGDKLGDKPSEANTAPQPRWKTKPDGRQIGRQAQRGGHSTPAKADTLKTALRTPTVNCPGKNPPPNEVAARFCSFANSVARGKVGRKAKNLLWGRSDRPGDQVISALKIPIDPRVFCKGWTWVNIYQVLQFMSHGVRMLGSILNGISMNILECPNVFS